MITIYEMLESVPKQLFDSETDSFFSVLMKKSVDSNIFISEEAEKTLFCLCRVVNEAKIVPLFLAQSGNKSSVIRSEVCRCLTVILVQNKGKK